MTREPTPAVLACDCEHVRELIAAARARGDHETIVRLTSEAIHPVP